MTEPRGPQVASRGLYEVICIGAGPTGLACAMEAKRAVNVRAQADLARYQPLLLSADDSKLEFDAVQA